MRRILQALIPVLPICLLLAFLSAERGPTWLRIVPHCPHGYDRHRLEPQLVSRLFRQHTGQALPSQATLPYGLFRLRPEGATLQLQFELPPQEAQALFEQVQIAWAAEFGPGAREAGTFFMWVDAPATHWRPAGLNVLIIRPEDDHETQFYIHPKKGHVGLNSSRDFR